MSEPVKPSNPLSGPAKEGPMTSPDGTPLALPISIAPANIDDFKPTPGIFSRDKMGSWVSIRPCAEEYKNKTFLGIYIGDIPIGFSWEFAKDGGLQVKPGRHNPAILIPELQKVILGAESWWGRIESPEKLREIKDIDIDNVWYVQALRQLEAEAAAEAEADEKAEAPA